MDPLSLVWGLILGIGWLAMGLIGGYLSDPPLTPFHRNVVVALGPLGLLVSLVRGATASVARGPRKP